MQTTNPNELKTKSILVNLTEAMLTEIDDARFAARCRSRNDWIRAAIREKLENEKKEKN